MVLSPICSLASRNRLDLLICCRFPYMMTWYFWEAVCMQLQNFNNVSCVNINSQKNFPTDMDSLSSQISSYSDNKDLRRCRIRVRVAVLTPLADWTLTAFRQSLESPFLAFRFVPVGMRRAEKFCKKDCLLCAYEEFMCSKTQETPNKSLYSNRQV